MSVRSKYTGKTRHTRAPAPAPAEPPKKQGKSSASKAAGALKRFVGWVQKNQEDYKRKSGDSSLEEDLRNIPIRVCRNAGNAGREESQRIRERCKSDEDDELCRYLSGRPSKRQAPAQSHPQHLEFNVKPKPKRRPDPKVKIIYVPYDPNATVERR